MILCRRLNIRITPIHVLRVDPRIKIADVGFKTTYTDICKLILRLLRRAIRNMPLHLNCLALISTPNARGSTRTSIVQALPV